MKQHGGSQRIDSEDRHVKSGILGPIIVGIVVALVAGGSAPWWWTKVVPGQSSTTSRPLPPLASPWPTTGDDQMDAVFDQLNRIERRGTATEAELTLTLRQFFKRAVFIDILEEPLESAAFVFGHAERLLNHYHPFFDQHKAAHDAIGTAKTRLIKLQQTISQACGQNRFFVQTRFNQFATKKAEFENLLLQANGNPLVLDNTAQADANQTLNELREALQTGLSRQ